MSQILDQSVVQSLSSSHSQSLTSALPQTLSHSNGPIVGSSIVPGAVGTAMGQSGASVDFSKEVSKSNASTSVAASSVKELVTKGLAGSSATHSVTNGHSSVSNNVGSASGSYMSQSNNTSLNTNSATSSERGMTPNLNSSDNLFVANLQAVSLEKLVKSKLEVLFQQQRDANIELSGLYDIVLEQVEKPLIELALLSRNGNQVKTAQLLGINRNTLKKKIDTYKIRIKKASSKDHQ